ncbi:lysophosphatidylserine lipase ABHD12-like isoform X2 [Myripristis murdjan]|uniref:lysophosphatidylserine lipase ABHD12-like isoform X2 n=1 Tax=Myripristis murdjan TaxID=586833 RepID=UPI001176285E|nr:lysophosphatidylserine lipase ABHD12-like isoform X2 [Myripristis murdjan]
MRKRVPDQDDSSSSASPAQKTARVPERKAAPSPWWVWLKRGLLVVFLVYISVPVMLKVSPAFVKHLVYSNKGLLSHIAGRAGTSVDLSRPADFSLNHTINMYLTPEEGISLGVWHTVPESQWKEAQGKDSAWYQKSLSDGSPVFIYLHGANGTRAESHRVGVANVLSANGYHVLAVDYRGFGDSSGEPSEASLTSDTVYVYHWVKARSGDSKVVIWGHSLGSGVATNTAVKLMEQGVVVDGVILEGTLKNTREQMKSYFTRLYGMLPGFEYFFIEPMAENEIIFPNDENVKKMRSPLLFLHSEDDHVISLHMAQQVYERAVSAQSPERVQMVTFSGSLGYRHNGLYKDPRTPGILKKFVQSL